VKIEVPMNGVNKNSFFLYCGIIAILGYIANIIILGELYSNYSHMKQQISELGMSNAPNYLIFAFGEIIAGTLFMISSIGTYFVIVDLTNKKYLAFLFSLCLTFFGINFLFSGIFPLPDERHNGYGMGALVLLAPIFLTWSCWNIPKFRIFAYLNLTVFILLISMMLLNVLFGSVHNQGLLQRVFVISIFLWISSVYTYFIKTNKR